MAGKYNQLVLEAAHSFIGSPFRHHFEPNICESGLRTVDTCMEAGMDPRGFDCSGLVVASLCGALDIDPSEWNWNFRHLRQLATLRDPEINNPNPGDLIIFAGLGHISICASANTMIHSSRISRSVEETAWDRSKSMSGSILIETILDVAA